MDITSKVYTWWKIMKTVSQFISEALITFGKSAYPKFGNIVILAGGAGSGK